MRWIIGDIHGMLAPLETLLRVIATRDPNADLFFAGDYVNRGPDSRRVIDLLLTLPRAHFVRGNHDDTLDMVLSGASQSQHEMLRTRAFALRNMLNYGLDATLRSYGVPPSEIQRIAQNPSESILNDLATRIPQPHRDFIHNLKLFTMTDHFFVAHAKLPPDASLDEITHHRSTLLWGRFTADEIPAQKSWTKRGYFGHTPVQNYSGLSLPIVGQTMALLDTAAALYPDGRLTAYCHEDNTFIQSDPRGNLA